MKLSELAGRSSSFTLSINNKEYFLRPLTPGDASRIEREIGDIGEIFDEGKYANFFKIAYLLLEPASTLDFAKQKVEFVDMNGDKKEEITGGYALFVNMITTVQEQFDVIKACLTSMGVSKKVMAEIFSEADKALNTDIDVEAIKKKDQKGKKLSGKK